jgi:hypothetical protein
VKNPKLPAVLPVVELSSWLSRLGTGPAWQIGELTLVPLTHTQVLGTPDTLIDEAIESNLLDLVEREGGVVQQVLAKNLGDTDVLILEGETLIGCKQNRMVAWSVLVGAGTTVPVSVGCMERGRWSKGGFAFKPGAMSVDPHIRRRSKRETSLSFAHAGGPHLDQGRAWSDVDDKLKEWNVSSVSEDYHSGLLARVMDARARLKALKPVERQIGVLALVHDRLLGLELVGHPKTWAALARRILPSYALGAESASRDPEFEGTRAGKPDEWLSALANAKADFRRARGKGMDGVIRSDAVTGSCLWNEGSIRHVVVFAA